MSVHPFGLRECFLVVLAGGFFIWFFFCLRDEKTNGRHTQKLTKWQFTSAVSWKEGPASLSHSTSSARVSFVSVITIDKV